jgi:hypothetical protein
MALTPAGPGSGQGPGRTRPPAGPAVWSAGWWPSSWRGLHHRDLVTAIDGVALGGEGGWWSSAQRPGDRLVYQVVRGGQPREVPVTLRRVEVANRPLQAWGPILFVAVLFVVVAYLYLRRPGPATGDSWCWPRFPVSA